jgi:hypothetical protein
MPPRSRLKQGKLAGDDIDGMDTGLAISEN